MLGRAAGIFASEATLSAKASYGKVEVLRDTWGIPHVFADTDVGAMYGLGQAVAEDRGFQIHYNLRTIQGRLAEILVDQPSQRQGKSALAHDQRMRTFGFYRAAGAMATKIDPRTLALLQAYSAGINDWFADQENQRHPLFAKFDLTPEPWTPADCIASLWNVAQFFAGDGTNELATYRELAKGHDILPPANLIVDDTAAVVGPDDVGRDWLDRVARFHQEHGGPPSPAVTAGPEGPKFSHAWVVGGKKTTTGAAVLVSDPQTPVLNPSLWYEFHVCGASFNARGVGVPGSPGIMIGWNENFAWGVTALGADQADLFRLKTDDGHPNQYFLDGQWQDMAIIKETIRVKNAKPVELVVRGTFFGPVVTSFASTEEGDPEVALKRVPMCFADGAGKNSETATDTIQGLLGMMRATDLDSFTQAIAHWHFPSANLVFGDKQGNIGYWLQAAIPIRSPRDTYHGAAAIDGSESRSDWQGFVPHELLPHVINPARGWIASGNHRPIGSFYPIVLGPGKGSTGHTLRSWRLYERLSAKKLFEPADVLDIHFDTVNPARRDIVRLGLHLRDELKHKLSPDAHAALQHLVAWYQQGAKSELTNTGAALAGQIDTEFRARFTPLAVKFGGGNGGLTSFLTDLQMRLTADPHTKLSPEEQDFIDRTLASAWKSGQKQYGTDPDQWDQQARALVEQQQRGYLNGMNAFGSLDPSADLKTPALTCVDGSTIKSQGSQSYTQYVPLDNVDAAQSMLPPGHSEKSDSAWRLSTWKLWANGELHPAPLSRQAVEKIAR